MTGKSEEQSPMDISEFTTSGEIVLDKNAPNGTHPDVENSTTWADNNGLEGFESPDALSQLYNKGWRFKKVPAFFWNYDSEEPKLSKCCSVHFMVDSVCTSQEILEAFDKAGIDIDEICSIQRRNSNRSWVVTLILIQR